MTRVSFDHDFGIFSYTKRHILMQSKRILCRIDIRQSFHGSKGELRQGTSHSHRSPCISHEYGFSYVKKYSSIFLWNLKLQGMFWLLIISLCPYVFNSTFILFSQNTFITTRYNLNMQLPMLYRGVSAWMQRYKTLADLLVIQHSQVIVSNTTMEAWSLWHCGLGLPTCLI